ncbi:MAG: hypothetical protein ACFFDT_07305, partial [Candidatus Hodarchaeota archaeon]
MSAKRDIRYWTGVLNTVKLINKFLDWKSKNPHEDQTLKDLLMMMYQKAEQKIGVEEDLADELGVSYLRTPKAKRPAQKPVFQPDFPPEAVTTEPTVPEPTLSSEPAAPEPTLSSEPAAPKPFISEPAAPEPFISEPAASEPFISEPTAPEPPAPEPILPPERSV